MARQKGRHNTQSKGFTPVRINGTNTPVTGEGDRAFVRALRQFSKRVADADILGEVKRREHYEKPSVRRKREADQARRRERKRQSEQEKRPA